MGPRAGLDVLKISAPPGFNLQTVQPVASRYTDCANPTNERFCFTYFLYLLSDLCHILYYSPRIMPLSKSQFSVSLFSERRAFIMCVNEVT